MSFIQKLFGMVEDPELDDIIRWAPNNLSFLVTPSEDFTRALGKYFKHANIASFIRQLNMYGFHKVSDGTSEKKPNGEWEFKHSQDSFKRGDVESLKLIKRRPLKPPATSSNDGEADLKKEDQPQSQSQSQARIPVQLSPYEFQSYTPHNGMSPIDYNASSENVQAHYYHQQQAQAQAQAHAQAQAQAQQQQHIQRQHHQQQHIQSPSTAPQPIYSGAASPSGPSTAYGEQQQMMYSGSYHLPPQITDLQMRLVETGKCMEKLLKINELYREELISLNYDVISMLDLMKDPSRDEKALNDFRSTVLQRSAQRDMTIKGLLHSASPDLWERQGSVSSVVQPGASFRPVAAAVASTGGMGVAGPVGGTVGGANGQFGRNPSTTSITSNPYFSNIQPGGASSGPSHPSGHYFPDYYQQQGNGVFLHKDIRYSISSSGNYRSRNPSIHDPLAPNKQSPGSTAVAVSAAAAAAAASASAAAAAALTPSVTSVPPPPPSAPLLTPGSGASIIGQIISPDSASSHGSSKKFRGKRSSAVYAMLNSDEGDIDPDSKRVKMD